MRELVDAFATAPWYLDHIAPIWRALGDDAQGRLHVSRPLLAQAAALGLDNVTAMPPAGGGRPLLTVGYGDMSAARRAGRSRLVLGQHGAGQSYRGSLSPSYPGGPHQDGVGLFLVPNDTARRYTVETYPDAAVAVVGCPKLDALPPRAPDDDRRPVVAISVHWDARVMPESTSAWPHFRGALLRLARRYRVLGHGHPRMQARLAPYFRQAHIEQVASFEDIVRRADLYICDNSSSMFEFAAMGRPVVVLNAPTYRRNVDHGLRFWQAATVGVQVDYARDLDAAVDRALRLLPADVAAREAALDVVYRPRSGGAVLAARVLRHWAATGRLPEGLT